MTLKPRSDLEAPPEDLHLLSNTERKIGRRPIFLLEDVKIHIEQTSINGLSIANSSAELSLQDELQWRLKDVCNFISCLQKHHYQYSEWCYGSGPGAKIAFPADVYIMGFNRVWNKEWPQQDPKNYFKFSFSVADNTIEIFSLHPERQIKNY